ncbi:hypothetical protein Trco_003708 [Trichoderma cornu-damae]|uniref:Uncharacterized protein n=1 Tax=Trichoderma cornu-damae TaxID=654480 RepID=A0A9P8QPT0_9HYPO|nr:hypothetical protein Trco_003708 [Trichoderma cornu-damae]
MDMIPWLGRRHSPGNGAACEINGPQGPVVAPPLGPVGVGQVQGEEDEQRGYDEAAVQGGRRDVVVLQPPAGVPPPDEVVEGDAGEAPAEVDVDGGRGQQADAAEDDGGADVAPEGLGPAASQQPGGDGRDGADEPEPLQGGVEGAVAEDAGGADGAPDDGGRVEDAAAGARVVVLLVHGADVGDVAQGPVHDGNLHNGGPHGGDELRREHDAGGHLHVVAELEVLGKVQGLGHGDVAVVFEHHHGEGPAGNHVADDEFGEDVEAELDAHVDVVLLVAGQLELAPNLLAVVQGDVDEHGGDGGKRQAVGEGELGGQEQGRILLVGGLVEVEVVSEDARDVVNLAEVVVGLGRLDGEVGGVPGAAEVDAHGDDDEEDDDAAEDVGDGVEGGDEGRAQEAAVDGPVEGDGHEAVPVGGAEDLVDDDVGRGDPADPGKGGQALEDPAGEPVPDEGAEADDEEELVAADGPAAVEEGDVDQVGGPDHGGGPNQEAAGQAGQAVPGAQGGDAEEKLEGPAEVLLVEELLGQQDVGGIEHATTIGSLYGAGR